MNCSDGDDAIVNPVNDRRHEEQNDNNCVDDGGIMLICMDVDTHHIGKNMIEVSYPSIRTIDQSGAKEVLLTNLTTTTNYLVDNYDVVLDAIISYPNKDDITMDDVVMTDDHEPSLDIAVQILPDADSTTATKKIDNINNDDMDGQGSCVLKINDIVTVAVGLYIVSMIIYHPLSVLHHNHYYHQHHVHHHHLCIIVNYHLIHGYYNN